MAWKGIRNKRHVLNPLLNPSLVDGPSLEDCLLGIATRLGGRGEREAGGGREGVLGSDVWGHHHQGSCEYAKRGREKGDEKESSADFAVATGHFVVEDSQLGVAPRLKLNIHRARGHLRGINRQAYLPCTQRR